MKILLIDDEPFALSLFVRQLANLGFTDVTPHQHANNALAELESGVDPVDLVFCDLQMPLMDGVEFVRHLAGINYRGGLVLVSGEDSRVLQSAHKFAKAHHLNILGALCKPVSKDALRPLLLTAQAYTENVPDVISKNYSPEEIQNAITNGELINFYQPKVDVATGKLVGVETLVRWQHPQDGLVYPDQFIATAEEHGLIDDLTLTVLSSALAQMRHWLNEDLSLHVAVNISMHNLASLAFPEVVVRAIERSGVPQTRLVLEITESRLMHDLRASLDILTRLRLKRIGLSIDDFGTGHSSLAQLRDLPFDELKIDRGFVHDAHRDMSLRAIFEASLGMARQLGIKTVAEGVEDEEDWRFLRTTHCDQAQGYFIARPMPAADLVKWCEDWERRKCDFGLSAKSGTKHKC